MCMNVHILRYVVDEEMLGCIVEGPFGGVTGEYTFDSLFTKYRGLVHSFLRIRRVTVVGLLGGSDVFRTALVTVISTGSRTSLSMSLIRGSMNLFTHFFPC